MSTRAQRDFLKVQLLETQRLRRMAENDPLMALSLGEREQELQEQIQALPLGDQEARVVLFFSGEPVQGSAGIDAGFVGRVLDPFQGMVMADYADRWHGKVGNRGRRSGEAESRLLLTGLPRGSFGLELQQADPNELFSEGQLADTLAHVTRLVDAAGRSDEDFAASLDDVAPRVIQNLRSFLEAVSKGKAGLRLESGDFRCVMDPAQANEAYGRAAGTRTTEEPIKIRGIFKGRLLESWKFDFIGDEERGIGGRIDESLTEEEVIELNRKFFNERCVASLLRTIVLFKNGRVRTTYILEGLEAPEPSPFLY